MASRCIVGVGWGRLRRRALLCALIYGGVPATADARSPSKHEGAQNQLESGEKSGGLGRKPTNDVGLGQKLQPPRMLGPNEGFVVRSGTQIDRGRIKLAPGRIFATLTPRGNASGKASLIFSLEGRPIPCQSKIRCEFDVQRENIYEEAVIDPGCEWECMYVVVVSMSSEILTQPDADLNAKRVREDKTRVSPRAALHRP